MSDITKVKADTIAKLKQVQNQHDIAAAALEDYARAADAPNIAEHATQLRGAADIVQTWIDGIGKKI
jgi:hypothetical protein